MPYIRPEDRENLKHSHPGTPGELNYEITKVLDKYIQDKGLNYRTISDCIAAAEGAKLEFYRRVAAPYEDEKIEENGDVYSPKTLGVTDYE